MLALLVILAVSTAVAVELLIDIIEERAEADDLVLRQTRKMAAKMNAG
ncbi:hypothetical protein [Rhizobium sp. RU36D]|nr:hypothetical protein [Rhizobium sp. RU36D]SMC67931.1 hypothetical protein SAMN05880593_104217 [Rhizobium sp. RU36D]